MVKVKNQYEKKAREAAKRLDRARASGDQLSFLPDEVVPDDVAAKTGAVGRPPGARNKVSSQMRDFLISKGYDAPEHALAQMAGLASRDDAILTAMQATERLLAWAGDGKYQTIMKEGKSVRTKQPWSASPDKMLAVFMQIYTIQLRALDALLPYIGAKVTPDVVNNNTNQIIIGMSHPPAPGATGQDRKSGPPPQRKKKTEQNQDVIDADVIHSDAEDRTE
ncbi:MAG: hypothetical protein QM492_07070 [Rhodobacterales bacterium]